MLVYGRAIATMAFALPHMERSLPAYDVRHMHASPRLGRAARWKRFVARASELSADVREVRSADELDGVLRALSPTFATETARVVYPHGSTSGEQAGTVLARGQVAVAETGSVLLVEPQADRRACLLADHLVLVVGEQDIVPSLDDALARVAALVRGGQRYATFVSGPSRTADIERVLTLGVHGPGQLTVLVVADEARPL